MIKGIIFDFDLTLMDTSEACIGAREKMRDVNGINISGILEKEVWGMTFKEFCERLSELNDFKFTTEEICKLNLKYTIELLENSQLNSISLLKKLYEQGIKIGIVSNSISEIINFVLKQNSIEFDFVFCSDELNLSKENLIKKGMDIWNINSDDCLYVGDHPNDVLYAKKIGVKSVAVSSGYNSPEELSKFSPDFLIGNLDELENIVFS